MRFTFVMMAALYFPVVATPERLKSGLWLVMISVVYAMIYDLLDYLKKK